ncbi:MAG TPA: universal stress protein [Pilimelia sp.]|nr:universal stress protein [Pilimelia sp.]
MSDPIVVGVEGSPHSHAAAQWAAEEAELRGAPLHLLYGYLHPLSYALPYGPYPMPEPAAGDAAAQVLAEAAGAVRARWPRVPVTESVAPEPGASLLVEASRAAQLVVVGSHGSGGFAGLLLGSVSRQVAAHAHCPVAVVRGTDAPVRRTGPVTVGVDGSARATAAAVLAAEEARRRKRPVELLHAWWANPYGHLTASFDEADRAAREAADAVVAEAAAAVAAAAPGVEVVPRLVHSLNPADTLAAASKDAALVVVGSRGRSGFAELLLGSVSETLLHHAHSPVLVVREPTGHREAEE